MGQLISSTGLEAKSTTYLVSWVTLPSPQVPPNEKPRWSAFSPGDSSPLAVGHVVSGPAPSEAGSSECSKLRQSVPHHRPGSPHRNAEALPSHRWWTIPVLPRSPGPSSAACIGPWHLSQFPVSLHLSRDQGAEGVQVTSPTAEIFPKQRELRTNLWLCALGQDIAT